MLKHYSQRSKVRYTQHEAFTNLQDKEEEERKWTQVYKVYVLLKEELSILDVQNSGS